MCFIKNKSKSSPTRWRHRLLWHGRSCSARGYVSPISVHNLPRLRSSNIDRSIERKWIYSGKGKKQKIPRTNYYGRWLRWWQSTSSKYSVQAESLLHNLEMTAGGIGLNVNADKTKFMFFNLHETRDISTLPGGSLKLVNTLTNLGSSVLSTENDINKRQAIDRLSVI